MTVDISSPTVSAPASIPVKAKKSVTVEKVMLLFTLIFVSGIVLYSVLTGPVRVIAVGIVACSVAYILLKPSSAK